MRIVKYLQSEAKANTGKFIYYIDIKNNVLCRDNLSVVFQDFTRYKCVKLN